MLPSFLGSVPAVDVFSLLSCQTGVAMPPRRLSSILHLFEGGNRSKLLCRSPPGWMVQEKRTNQGRRGGPASCSAKSHWVPPAQVTRPRVAFVPALALCAKKAKRELTSPSDTRFHCCWGCTERAKPPSSWARALSPQSPAASPLGGTESPPRLEKFTLDDPPRLLWLLLQALAGGFTWVRWA